MSSETVREDGASGSSTGGDGEETRPTGASRLRSIARRILSELVVLGLVLGFTFAARSALADHYWVPSGSMQHTLVEGDRVIVNKTAYGLRLPFTDFELLEGDTPERGDVVVFDSPEADARLIKRVVAVGGDRVDLIDGHLIINGEPLRAPDDPSVEFIGEHVARLNLDAGGGPDIRGMVVPEGEVLVLGDHRGVSRDGRYFGTISEDEIYGRAVAIYWRSAEWLTWKPL